MKAVEFKGQTTILGPPRGWDNSGNSLQCGGLPTQETAEQGVRVLRSFWRPSPEDLIMLNNGAHVCLGVVGGGHPPVMLTVERAEELP